jgi:non-homologous end joining protein Ku
MPLKPQPTHRQTNVINLMDALRRSVEGTGAEGATKGAIQRERARKPASKARAATRAKGKARKAG